MENRIRGGPLRSLKVAASFALALISIGIAFTASVVDARQPDNVDVVAIQTAIETGNRTYLAALKGRDARRFAALFAEDAISLPPSGPPIRGRVNIEASISSAFERVTFLDGSTHTLELQLSAGNAIEIGSYRYAILTDGVPEELHGRYLTMWRLINGAWKIAVDSSQPDAPVPEPVGTLGPATSASETPLPGETGIPMPAKAR